MTKITSLLTLLCLLLYSCTAQKAIPKEASALIEKTNKSDADSLKFPESWAGVWEGELSIYSAKGLSQKLPMELHILPTDSLHRFDWTIIYGEDKVKGARNYQLLIKDRQKGVYAVDELNSISLECYLIEDQLFSWYAVNDVLILISYKMRGEEIMFEVVAGSHTPISVTGGETIKEGEEEEEIPEVSTYPVKSSQQAVLRRKK